MIIIDENKCISCGLCIKDCAMGAIRNRKGVIVAPKECMECGHCVAICPQNAVTMEGYDMTEVVNVQKTSAISPEDLLTSIKSRRSIRKYKEEKLSEETLNMLFETVRYTATAKNTQANKIVLVQDKIEEFCDLVYSSLEKMFEGCVVKELDPNMAALYLFTMNYRRNKADNYLLRNAPAVMFIANPNPWDAGLAAQNVEAMATSLGLGVLYNGYLARVVNSIPVLKEWLGIPDDTITAAMLIGYPDVKYQRTAPRKKADVIRR